MPKKTKLSTPEWVIEGYDSKADWEKVKGVKGEEKGKNFSIKVCPKCKSNDVSVVLGGKEGKKVDEWECKKCGWKGKNIIKKELNENEFMKYLD